MILACMSVRTCYISYKTGALTNCLITNQVPTFVLQGHITFKFFHIYLRLSIRTLMKKH